jgi:hypothetical protein
MGPSMVRKIITEFVHSDMVMIFFYQRTAMMIRMYEKFSSEAAHLPTVDRK